MTGSLLPQNLIAELVLSAETEDERRKIANAFVAYGLGTLAAMDGETRAAEVGYRLADALVARSGT